MAPRSKPGLQTKGESLTVRLDPKRRYALELLARKHRRNLSGVIEWLIEGGVKNPEGGLLETKDGKQINLLEKLWDIDEWDRLYNMQVNCPALMTFEEEKIAKFIFSSDFVDQLHASLQPLLLTDNDFDKQQYADKFKAALRPHFSIFVKVAMGELNSSKLPVFTNKDSKRNKI